MSKYFINTVDFWVDRLGNPKRPLLSEYEINELNKTNAKNTAVGINDLQQMIDKDFITGVALRRTKVKTQPIKHRVCGEDTAFDDNLESVILPYEPVLIKPKSYVNEFYYVVAGNTKGYVLAKDIGFTDSKSLWDIFANPKDFYVVKPNIIEATNDFERLYMGVKIPTEIQGIGITPVLNGKNQLSLKNIYINDDERFNLGYLPFTEENILKQAFLCYGDIYGWGGDFNSRDCSSFVGEIFRSFGIYLGRNVSNQRCNGIKNYDVSSMDSKEKEELICGLKVGSQLIFKRHTSMYIGNINGKPYIIHSLSSMGDFWGSKINVSKVVVTSTDITRWKTNKTFIDSFTDISEFKI